MTEGDYQERGLSRVALLANRLMRKADSHALSTTLCQRGLPFRMTDLQVKVFTFQRERCT